MAMNSGFEREVRFDIVEEIGIISTHSTGWRKELNLVCWNGGGPKYDIRDWSPDHERMSRGITLHENEMRQIFDLMRRRRINSRSRRAEPEAAEPADSIPNPPTASLSDDFDDMEVNEDGEVINA